jgi:translation initiation factor 2B subunit (eIF-2B alpha/beta/delta family)
VEVVADEMVPDALYAVDVVIVGAHALGPDAAVNVAGTSALAKEASNLGVRVVVLASADKALPELLFDRAAAAATASHTLEVLRLAAVDSVVTELGVLDAAGARRLAEGRVVARQLL